LVLFALSTALSGCLSGGRSTTVYHGTYVSPAMQREIYAGTSGKDQVRAIFGEPTECVPLESGAEIWRWEYTESVESGWYIVPFNWHEHREVRQGRVFVEFNDRSIAQRVWRDDPKP